MVRVVDLEEANFIWLEALTLIHGVHHTRRAGDQGAGEMGIRGYPVIARGKHRRFTQATRDAGGRRAEQGESLSLGHSFGCRLIVDGQSSRGLRMILGQPIAGEDTAVSIAALCDSGRSASLALGYAL